MQKPYEKEGVVKYIVQHVSGPITLPADIGELLAWRRRLRELELIGADAQGLGYGNISVRWFSSPRFLITGSQSSGLVDVDQRHFASVTVVDLDRNFLRSTGETPPSSEALTHAALYQSRSSIRAVVHVHSHGIWTAWRDRLPTTRNEVAYGTPEMAYEMIRLNKRSAITDRGAVVMGGHQDGIVAFGPTIADAAGEILKLMPQAGLIAPIP